jgi:signal transduction histidine kinase
MRSVQTFQPAAEQKHLRFSTTVEPGVPEQIETDPQRLGQILKNLLSNAFKFTEKGEVALRVFSTASGQVSFARCATRASGSPAINKR